MKNKDFFENQEVEVMYDASETSVDTHFRIEMAKEERCRRHQIRVASHPDMP